MNYQKIKILLINKISVKFAEQGIDTSQNLLDKEVIDKEKEINSSQDKITSLQNDLTAKDSELTNKEKQIKDLEQQPANPQNLPPPLSNNEKSHPPVIPPEPLPDKNLDKQLREKDQIIKSLQAKNQKIVIGIVVVILLGCGVLVLLPVLKKYLKTRRRVRK
ncbi:25445_t:CDS:2 [Gigaspora margarita]|uniref:25445_t:CDS:1 n=1 Tax=Gigaspora margarita TaxID=4874 RepID=A0ABN7UR42_GIGMA|nr:25445_t:CDS:2 [Gigaspora margarita]